MKRIAILLALGAGVVAGLTVGAPAGSQVPACLPGSTDPNYCPQTTTTDTTTTTTPTTTTGTTTTQTTTTQTTTTQTTTTGTTTTGTTTTGGGATVGATATLAGGLTISQRSGVAFSHLAVAANASSIAHAAADGSVELPGVTIVCHGPIGRSCVAKVRFDSALGLLLHSHDIPGYTAGYTRATLARLHYTVPAETIQVVKVKLSRRGRRLLRSHNTIAGRIIVLLHGADGAFSAMEKPVTIKLG